MKIELQQNYLYYNEGIYDPLDTKTLLNARKKKKKVSITGIDFKGEVNIEEIIKKLPILEIVEDTDAPDSLSFKHYETEDYWWVIAIANDIMDPTYYELRRWIIPDVNYLDDYL